MLKEFFELKAGETKVIELDAPGKSEEETTREKQAESLKTADKKEKPTSPEAHTVVVRVVDEQEKPAADVPAVIQWESEKVSEKTDGSGTVSFSLKEGQDGPRNISIQPEGYVPLLWNPPVTPKREVPKEILFRLEREKTIGGTVQDEAGKPVEGGKSLH